MSAGGRAWRGWALPLPGGAVCLDHDAAALVLFLVRWYVTTTAPGNGRAAEMSGSPMLLEVRAACELATREVSGSGHPLRTFEENPAISAPRPDDLMTTAQVAEELNVDERTARRWVAAGDLGVVTYAGRAKLVRRFEVDAHKRRRARRTR